MRPALAFLLLLTISVSSFAADPPKTEEQKTLYTLGVLLNRSVAPFQLSPAELELVKQGLTDAATGKALAVDLQAYGPKVQELADARRKAQADKLSAASKGFEEKAAKEKGAVKTASGLIYTSQKEGTGKSPGPTSTVKVNYRGTLPDGKEFDSSYKRGTPAEFSLNGVIKCFSEGIQKMKVGGKAKLVCPSNIAYGDQGAGGVIPPGATLMFEVELLGIKE
ncbi:MAG: peptidylprolyl isomerase [Deltaproteobacteria bacterium]|nr:peptidylprolyl isomerase [Deltaproteobacteria bacterium]